jgi:hypothetical protein
MAEPRWQELQIFKDKVAAYLETHRKIIAEFERSLRNARHFIELANLSRERERDSTVTMLEQIKEIDLLGHVNTQFDAFREVSDLLPQEANNAEVLEAKGNVDELNERYELLLEEAEQQQDTIREIIQALEEPD